MARETKKVGRGSGSLHNIGTQIAGTSQITLFCNSCAQWCVGIHVECNEIIR